MSIRYQLNETIMGSGISAVKVQSFSNVAHVQISEDVPTDETDLEIALVLDVDQIAFVYINSTQDVTFETNIAATPDNTIALTANNPYVWHTGSYHALLLTVDITKIFITNTSGSTAEVTVWALYDSTP